MVSKLNAFMRKKDRYSVKFSLSHGRNLCCFSCDNVVNLNCLCCRIALQHVATRNSGELFSGMSKRHSEGNIARVWKQTKQIILGAIGFVF